MCLSISGISLFHRLVDYLDGENAFNCYHVLLHVLMEETHDEVPIIAHAKIMSLKIP